MLNAFDRADIYMAAGGQQETDIGQQAPDRCHATDHRLSSHKIAAAAKSGERHLLPS